MGCITKSDANLQIKVNAYIQKVVFNIGHYGRKNKVIIQAITKVSLLLSADVSSTTVVTAAPTTLCYNTMWRLESRVQEHSGFSYRGEMNVIQRLVTVGGCYVDWYLAAASSVYIFTLSVSATTKITNLWE